MAGVMLTLLAAIIIHSLALWLAWTWSRVPFINAFLEHTLVVSEPAVDPTGSALVDLYNPERILAINGQPVHNRHQLEAVLSRLQVGDTVTLQVETPDDRGGWTVRLVSVRLNRLPPAAWIENFFAPYLVGLAYLIVGIWVFIRRRSSSQVQTLALFCASTATLMATTFDMQTTHILTRLWAAAFPLTGLTLVYLAWSFFELSSSLRWIRVGKVVLLAPAGALIVWSQVAHRGADPRGYFVPWLWSYVFLAASVLAFVGMLTYVRLRPSFTRIRLQAQIILVGIFVSFFPTMVWIVFSVVGRLIPAIGLFYPFEALVNFPPLVFLPLSIAYVVLRYQFMDVDLLFNPFYQNRREAQIALQRFSRELTASLDVNVIIERLLSHIEEIFHPRYMVVLMLAQEDSYSFFAGRGLAENHAAMSAQFGRQDALLVKMQRENESLSLENAQGWIAGLDAKSRDWLERLRPAVLVPLRAKEYLLGILVLGPLRLGDFYARDEVALLDALADQAAIAAENARLYAQQVEQGRYLIKQTRRLTDILALGNQLKSLDYEVVVQGTVDAVHQSLGFGTVILSLLDENDRSRVRVTAWAGVRNPIWERMSLTTQPFVDFRQVGQAQRWGSCYFVPAPDSLPDISTLHRAMPWLLGDQLYVLLTSNEGLLGYLTVDQPEDDLRPTEGTLDVLEIFANQAAVAIQNANLYASIDRALDERLAELSTLQEIDRQINAKLDFQHVMDTTLDWALRITGAVAGTLALMDESRQFLHIVAHRGYPPEMDRFWDAPWPLTDGIVGRVVRTGEPALVEGALQNDDYADARVTIRAHLSAPIQREGQVIGAISLEGAESGGFTSDHLAFLMRLADHATIAIENAGLYNQMQRRVAELGALREIGLELTSRLDLNAVLSSIANNARALVMADQITIYLYDAHQDVLSFGAGLSRLGQKDAFLISDIENQIAQKVARRGEPTVIDDTFLGGVSEHLSSELTDWHVRAIASIPLRADHVLGVFDIAFEKPHVFTIDELRVLDLLANQAAIAIKNAQLYADIQRANDAKSEFVSIVSHELKVPMTSIRGYARLITLNAGGPVTEKQQEFVNVILDNVDRMTSLVNDLLDSSRIESGRIQMSRMSVPLIKMVQDTVNSLQNEIKTRQHELVIDIAQDLPNVYADRTRIMQVLINLLSNAYKYTPSGGRIRVWAQVRAGPDFEEGEWVVCAVEDSGVGIQPKDMARIFQQFYRIRDERTANEPGTGLGLYITRRIVELHGGRIWVESTYGQGSTFFFTLPVAR